MSEEKAAYGSSSVPKRSYKDGGPTLSIVGFGGIIVMNAEQDAANRIVSWAVEQGINYFDVAPSYGDSELKLGPALEPYRKDVFLACKTTERTRDKAEEEFKGSLKRLRTDYFDLYQLHGLTDVKQDVDQTFAKGGVMELLLEAKRAGKIRYIGFSAHTEEAALAALDRFDFDSVLFPINFATSMNHGFGAKVLAKAAERGAARLALKALAKQKWTEGHPEKKRFPKCWYEPLYEPEWAELALRWTLSQPITAAVSPGEEDLFRLAVETAARFKPVTPDETALLKKYAASLDAIFPQQ
jgi:aryl-alcohol dehydrogenase-like predicted oxidoreductase